MVMKSDTLHFDEIIFFEKVLERNPGYLQALRSLAEAYTVKGLFQKGLEMDKRLAKLRPEDPLIHYNLACSFALTGQKENALNSLRSAIRLGYRDFSYLKKDRDLKMLHDDPAFKDLFPQKLKSRPKRRRPS